MAEVAASTESAARVRVQVQLLTGFLGSGKTTVLRRLAAQAASGELALIINEFADIGIDQQLVRNDEDVVLLEGGCVCCVVKDDLVEALHRLRVRRRSGEWPRPRRLVIETTGLADPNPIVHALQSDPRLRSDFDAASVLTVVDATCADEQIESFEEAARQVAAADHLLVSKADLATAERMFALRSRLAQLNPVAQQHRADHGSICAFDSNVAESIEALKQVGGSFRSVGGDGARHSAGISAHVIEYPVAVDWQAFSDWLQALCLARGRDLLRVKGLVYVIGEAFPRLINAVNFSVYPAETLSGERVSIERASRLVLIGRNLDAARLRQTLDAALR